MKFAGAGMNAQLKNKIMNTVTISPKVSHLTFVLINNSKNHRSVNLFHISGWLDQMLEGPMERKSRIWKILHPSRSRYQYRNDRMYLPNDVKLYLQQGSYDSVMCGLLSESNIKLMGVTFLPKTDKINMWQSNGKMDFSKIAKRYVHNENEMVESLLPQVNDPSFEFTTGDYRYIGIPLAPKETKVIRFDASQIIRL